MWLIVALQLGTAQAQDVLLPPLTPSSTSDFGVADELTLATVDAFGAQALEYAGPLDIRRRVGGAAEACFDTSECVPLLFDRFNRARIAVVGTAGWQDGQVRVVVRYYAQGDPSPIEVVSDTIDAGEMEAFATSTGLLAEELLGLLPPREVVGPAMPVEEDPEERPKAKDPVGERPPEERPAKPVEKPLSEGELLIRARRLEAERRMLGLPRRAFEHYKASGLSWDDWSDQARIRSRKGVIEVHGGLGFGDVDRRYDTRVWVDQTEQGGLSQVDTYQYETWLQGQAPEVSATIGFMPTWWVELGVALGVQVGDKQLTSGWEQTLDGDQGTLVDFDNTVYDPRAAVVGVVTPRVRLHVVAMGPVKPYLLAGASLRFVDGYNVPDLPLVDYPDRDGAMSWGPTAGGGLIVDLPRHAALVLEVPWTYLIDSDPYVVDSGLVQRIPAQVVGSGQVLTVRAGLGLRF